MARVYKGGRRGSTASSAGSSAASTAWPAFVPKWRWAGRPIRSPCSSSTSRASSWSMRSSACRASAPEPAGARGGDPGLLVQHRRQLRDQYQLAGLRRRDDHELPDADGRAHGAELRFRRGRHGDARGLHPRPRPALGARRSGTSGWTSLARPSTSCSRSRSCSRSPWFRRVWCRTWPPMRRRRLRPPTTPSRRPTRRDAGSGRSRPAEDQGDPLTEQVLAMGPAASQVAIKQLGTNGGGFFNVNSAHPYENPDAALELPRAARHSRDLRRALLHLRRHGRRHASGLGRARGDDDPVRRPARCLRGGGAERQGSFAELGVDHQASDAAGRRQHGGQGGPLRHRQFSPVGHRHHRGLQRVGQLDARFLHALGRPGADVADAARRGHLRRASARGSTACSCSPSSPSSSPG